MQVPAGYKLTVLEKITRISCDTDNCLENLKLALNRALGSDKSYIYDGTPWPEVYRASLESSIRFAIESKLYLPQTLQLLVRTQSESFSESTLEPPGQLLEFAVQCRHPAALATAVGLLDLYPDIGQDWLKANAQTLLSELLTTWPKVSYRTSVDMEMYSKLPRLYKTLLNANAPNNNALDSKGRTITHLAVETGNYVLLEALIETINEFTPNAGEGSKSGTPLHIAVRKPGLRLSWEQVYGAILLRLFEFDGINLESKDIIGRTPLSYAAGQGHDYVVPLFLERSDVTNPDSADLTGRTPLPYAASQGHHNVVQLFFRRSDVINPDLADLTGRTPLSYVADQGLDELVKLFLERSDVINPDLADLTGRTPLSYAAGQGQSKVVELLLESKDVDPVSKDNTGRTPLDWARIGGHTVVTETLTKYQIYDPDSWMLED